MWMRHALPSARPLDALMGWRCGRSLIVYDFPFSGCALRVEDAGIGGTALARKGARRIQCGGERNTTLRLAGVAEWYTRQSQKLLPFTGLWVRIPPPAPIQTQNINGVRQFGLMPLSCHYGAVDANCDANWRGYARPGGCADPSSAACG